MLICRDVIFTQFSVDYYFSVKNTLITIKTIFSSCAFE